MTLAGLLRRQVFTGRGVLLLVFALSCSLVWSTWLMEELEAKNLFLGPSFHWIPFSMIGYMSVDFFAFSVIYLVGGSLLRFRQAGILRDLHLAGVEWRTILRPFATLYFALMAGGNLLASAVDAATSQEPLNITVMTFLVMLLWTFPSAWFCAWFLVFLASWRLSGGVQIAAAYLLNLLGSMAMFSLSDYAGVWMVGWFRRRSYHPNEDLSWWQSLSAEFTQALTLGGSFYLAILLLGLIVLILAPIYRRGAEKTAAHRLIDP